MLDYEEKITLILILMDYVVEYDGRGGGKGVIIFVLCFEYTQ